MIVAAACLLIAGCSGSGGRTETIDPLVIINDARATSRERERAVQQVWKQAEAGQIDVEAARRASKELLFKRGAPLGPRMEAMRRLLSDDRAEGIEDTRRFVRLMLPTETAWPLLAMIADAVAERGWTDATVPLVRSYVREVSDPTDDRRPERRALERLHPEKDIVEIVYNVFTAPTTWGEIETVTAERVKNEAWELLGRLDGDGSARSKLLVEGSSGDPVAGQLREMAITWGVVPVTASEMSWAQGLWTSEEEGDFAWRTQVASAVASLGDDQRVSLQMRHLEPIRWAANEGARSEWLTADWDGLYRKLDQRLSGRRIHIRTENVPEGAARERLRDHRDLLSWGDLLTMLVIDEAMGDAAMASELITQARRDLADTSTEYGGAIFSASVANERARTANTKGDFVAVLYLPRATQRTSDYRYPAPEELFRESGRSLAHYHFHAQRYDNRAHAGPGPGDMEYARAHGRACVVLTFIRDGVLNVDYFQRNGAKVDLGEIETGAAR